MRTRAEVAAYINAADDYWTLPNTVAPGKVAHHWGKCEIRSLIDFIYEGAPRTPDETLWPPLRLRNRPGKMCE